MTTTPRGRTLALGSLLLATTALSGCRTLDDLGRPVRPDSLAPDGDTTAVRAAPAPTPPERAPEPVAR